MRVKAAGINPGEASSEVASSTRCGRRPSPPARAATSPAWSRRSATRSTACRAGDEVIGWTDHRAGQAELVVVTPTQLTAAPAVPWEVAGGLFVAGATAWAGVRAVA